MRNSLSWQDSARIMIVRCKLEILCWSSLNLPSEFLSRSIDDASTWFHQLTSFSRMKLKFGCRKESHKKKSTRTAWCVIMHANMFLAAKWQPCDFPRPYACKYIGEVPLDNGSKDNFFSVFDMLSWSARDVI